MTQEVSTSLQFVFSCPLSSGLHARPASHLAEVVNQFASDCTLTNLRNGLMANGKSVLGIIAADIRYSDQCAVRVSGADEHSAHAALRQFVAEALPLCDVPLAVSAAPIRSNTPPRPLKAAGVSCSFGVPVSRGIAHGKVVIVSRMTLPSSLSTPNKTDSQKELDHIKDAVAAVRRRIGEKLKYSITPAGTAVLQADLAMASDVFLVEKLTEQVLRGKSAGQAVVETGEFFIDLLRHSDNEYVRERSSDIEEICLQLLEEIYGASPGSAPVALHEPSVVVAETLAPQQLLELDRRWLKALVLEYSGSTSHAAILARSLGIPTLVGVRNARLVLPPGSEVVVDANRGLVVSYSLAAVRRFYGREQQTLQRRRELWSRQTEKPAITLDGQRIDVAANASSVEELVIAFENGADGIGLFRTEMIFLGREYPPSEEEQFAIYAEAARTAGGRPVVIRTIDIGGDKRVPYLNLPPEENPFLGYRGARIYAEHHQLLQSQLRAILRASALGQVQIMAPMISSLEEIVQFKDAIIQAKQHLIRNGMPFQPDLKVGIMVEVPSVAFILDQLCSEVDFFSIGTNDLSQYFFAADRNNSKVNELFSVRHPSFLRFLKQIVDQIRLAGKWAGMCGEMAADIRNLPLLVGLGLREISVPAVEVREYKRTVSRLYASDCGVMVERSIASAKVLEVDGLLGQQPLQAAQPLLARELILLGSTSKNKEEVIQEMVDAFYVASRTEDRHLLEEALWAREAVYSTGLGYGFATPHCKTDAVAADSICVLRLREPINWDSIDGERVRMVVLLALRNSEVANNHMQVFSTLARKLMNEDFRQHLLEVETADEATTYLAAQLGTAMTGER
ncbi:MAG: phosphoenolpyruvate--protein phosphotransferase [Acidobacteria bacterium]|nr:MAG: phosphoenolpyruvate--protein phosphotransferase [Acidobacteriota bacterium]